MDKNAEKVCFHILENFTAFFTQRMWNVSLSRFYLKIRKYQNLFIMSPSAARLAMQYYIEIYVYLLGCH